MTPPRPSAWQRWRAAWQAAPDAATAVGQFALYAAVRLWVLVISGFPIEMNLATARLFGRIWWALTWIPEERLPGFLRFLARQRDRDRAMANLRPALGATHSEEQLQRIARDCLAHFAQLYLVEAALTPRLVNSYSWPRYVEITEIAPALRVLLLGDGAIMITPHFGNFELLGFTLAQLGLPLTAVMRPLDNPLLTDFIESSRTASGLRLIHKKGATDEAPQLLAEGGTLCFIADQDAGRKGVFSMFFNRKASWYKSIGLLAMSTRKPIIIGQMVRVRSAFRYRLEVERIIHPHEWDQQPQPLQWITDTYAAMMEAAIRRHPDQYLWPHRRWKTRPKQELAAAQA
ncbi:MAG: lysophospholipid acyltransferase family protein [Planctomycetes bacterium]|nr:lysophospholipid acyltransferase family protein [Planctomycetota bacterium]